MVTNSEHWCRQKASSDLLEISIFGKTTLTCVTSVADYCLPEAHRISQLCQGVRHAQGKAPNVLLVDYPERAARTEHSPKRAAYLQVMF